MFNYKNYFHKGASGMGSFNVTETICCGKRVTLVEFRICVFFMVVNISQFKTQTQNSSLS